MEEGESGQVPGATDSLHRADDNFNFEDFVLAPESDLSLQIDDTWLQMCPVPQAEPEHSSTECPPIASIAGRDNERRSSYSFAEVTAAESVSHLSRRSSGTNTFYGPSQGVDRLNTGLASDSSTSLYSTPHLGGPLTPYTASPGIYPQQAAFQESISTSAWPAFENAFPRFEWHPSDKQQLRRLYDAQRPQMSDPNTMRHLGGLGHGGVQEGDYWPNMHYFSSSSQVPGRSQADSDLEIDGSLLGLGVHRSAQTQPSARYGRRRGIDTGQRASSSSLPPDLSQQNIGPREPWRTINNGGYSTIMSYTPDQSTSIVAGVPFSARDDYWKQRGGKRARPEEQSSFDFLDDVYNIGGHSNMESSSAARSASHYSPRAVIDLLDPPTSVDDSRGRAVTQSRPPHGSIPTSSVDRPDRSQQPVRDVRRPAASRRRVGSKNQTKCIDCKNKAHPDAESRCKRCYEKHLRHSADAPELALDVSVPDLAAAIRIIYPPTAAIRVMGDDVAEEKIREDFYIRRLLNAICFPATADRDWHGEKQRVIEWLINQQHIFNGRAVINAEDAYSDSNVTARLRMLFKATVDLHEGTTQSMYPAGGDSKGYRIDVNLTFSQRMAEMQECFSDCKTIAMNIIEGKGTMGFVGNPRAYYDRILSNLETNHVKKQATKKKQQAETSPRDTSDDTDESQEVPAGPRSVLQGAQHGHGSTTSSRDLSRPGACITATQDSGGEDQIQATRASKRQRNA